MKIRDFSGSYDVEDISFGHRSTNILLDIILQWGGSNRHIVEQEFHSYYSGGEVHSEYSRIHIMVDESNSDQIDIPVILANYLARHKLYIHHYDIVGDTTYVSYLKNDEAQKQFLDTQYAPSNVTREIYIDALVQPEEGVDYYKLLNIKKHAPFESISEQELAKLGYGDEIDGDYEVYFERFAILSEMEYRKYISNKNIS